MPIISYAQNFEDVIIWRALRHIKAGVYIDVGAQDPTVDSVSRLFYEQGWRGIHVEAQLAWATLLSDARPDEVVLPVALSDKNGTIKFYEIPLDGGGLSTGNASVATYHREIHHLEVHETVVPTVTLDEVFSTIDGPDIHWLKIDVEGMEGIVIDGWRDKTRRPWIVVIESTFPTTQRQTHETWEQKILDIGYTFAYGDGLNRFYVSNEKRDLLASFGTPPNVFDNFSLSGKSRAPFCKYVIEQEREAAAVKEASFDRNLGALTAERDDLRARATTLETDMDRVRAQHSFEINELKHHAEKASQNLKVILGLLSQRESELASMTERASHAVEASAKSALALEEQKRQMDASVENYRLDAIAAKDRCKKLKRKVKGLARELDIMVGTELHRPADNAKTNPQDGWGFRALRGHMDSSGLRRVGMNILGIFRGRSAEKPQS
jgi:FkbM family methyltransferase